MVDHESATFIDDDPGFIRWRGTHPDGFIVNHEREPNLVNESGDGSRCTGIDLNAQAKMQAVADQLGAKIATLNCPAAKP